MTDRLLAAGDRRAAFTDVCWYRHPRSRGAGRSTRWQRTLRARRGSRASRAGSASGTSDARLVRSGRGTQDCGAWFIAYASTASRFTPRAERAARPSAPHQLRPDLRDSPGRRSSSSGTAPTGRCSRGSSTIIDQLNRLLRASVIEARSSAPHRAAWLPPQRVLPGHRAGGRGRAGVHGDLSASGARRGWDDVLALPRRAQRSEGAARSPAGWSGAHTHRPDARAALAPPRAAYGAPPPVKGRVIAADRNRSPARS